MVIQFQYEKTAYSADLSQPIDISLRMKDGFSNPNCFWAAPPAFEAVRAGDFIGSTAEGGPVNFFNVRFNPHGNGTHTECVGHIAQARYTLPDCLKRHHFFAKLVSVYPQKMEDGDRVILLESLKDALNPGEAEALLIRTMPNDERKESTQYSGTNPPYLHHEAMEFLVECGIRHLLIDLPSVDREEDDGALLAHRAFWKYPEAVREDCSITELIYVPSGVKDGYYLVNIQTAPFDLDASPSKPLLFAVSRNVPRSAKP